MPCENAAQSNDYFEFIGEYSGGLDYVKEEFNTECITVIDQRFAIAYVKKNGRTSIYGQNYPYNTIPRCFGLMDTQMLEDVGVAQVRRSTLDLYGNGVLVGMIDTGIDYEHPAFRYEDGSSKIYSLWDQTIEGDSEDTFLGYGTEYTKEQIEEALKSDVPQQKVPSKDESGHGTFLAGLIAGNEDNETGFSGIAPNAGLIVVKLRKAKDYLNEYLKQYDFEIVSNPTSGWLNIADDQRYDIIDHDAIDAIEHRIGHICINQNLYSLTVFVEDLEKNRLGSEWFEINANGIETKENKPWTSWHQYIKDNGLNWNLEDMEKENKIRSLIHQCIDLNLLNIENGYIMVIRETPDNSTVWVPMSYEEAIEDLKNPKQFNSLLDAVNEIQKSDLLNGIPQEYSYPSLGIELNLEAVDQEYCYYLDQEQENLYVIKRNEITNSASIYEQLKTVTNQGNLNFTDKNPDVRIEASEGFSENRMTDLFLEYHGDKEQFDYVSESFLNGYEENIDEILEDQEDNEWEL